jgi:hypothetical protein
MVRSKIIPPTLGDNLTNFRWHLTNFARHIDRARKIDA